MLSISLSIVSFISLAICGPVTNLVLHEQRDSVPDGFVQNGPAPPSQVVNLKFALVQNNMAGLEEALYSVSTPSSASYGQHLSKEQVSTSFCRSIHYTLTDTNVALLVYYNR